MGTKGKVVEKTKIGNSLADNTKLTLRDEFRDNSVSFSHYDQSSFLDGFEGCCSHFSLENLVKRFRFLLYQIVMN